MSAVLRPARDDAAVERREKAQAAARNMRKLIESGDYAAVSKDARERFPKVLDALAK